MVGARPGCFPSSSYSTIHTHSLSGIPFFFRPYFMKLWHDGCFGGEECAVHQPTRPSPSPCDDIIGARQAANVRAHTRTSLHRRLASGCLSARLHR